MNTYDSLVVQSPYSIKKVTHIEIRSSLGEHAEVTLRGIVDEASSTQSATGAVWQDELIVYDHREDGKVVIFKGLITHIQNTHVNGVYYIDIEGKSASVLLDIKKKKRSFQNGSMTYAELVKSIVQEYPQADVSCNIGKGISIGEPIIQYDETDWTFINRLASCLNEYVIGDMRYDKPKMYFGTPISSEHKLPDDLFYTAGKDLAAFHQAGGAAAGLHSTDFFYYEITSDQLYQIGDVVQFKDKSLVISRMSARLEQGILTYNYRLSRRKGIWRSVIHNERLAGISLEGEVLAVQGEQIKLHLNIDQRQPKETAYWFPFAPPTGNVMYCMPQVGTNAILYIPGASGSGALVTGCVRTNGGDCEKTSDPNTRYFGTEHGSEVKLSPTGIDIDSGSAQSLKLSLEDESGVTWTSHKKITIEADEEIILHSQKRVVVQGESQVLLLKTGNESGVAIEGEYHVLGGQVKTEGSDRTSYAPYNDEPQVGTPPPPPEPEPKPPFNWKKLAMNVLGGLAVVAAVTAVAVLTVATLGASAVVIGAVAAGAAIAGTAAVASQAVSDIARGEVSDFSAYGMAALRESTIGAISGAVFGPFGALATVGGKMTLGATTNAFESVIRQGMEGKGFSVTTMLADASIGAVTAGVLDSRIAKKIGGAAVSRITKAAPWLQKGVGAAANQFNKQVNKLSDLGNQIGEKYLKEARDMLGDMADSMSGRIPALAGGVPNARIPDSNVMNSTSLPQNSQQQKFWSESEAGQKELAERMAKKGEGNVSYGSNSTDEVNNKIKNLDDEIDRLKKEGNDKEVKELTRERNKLANKLDTKDDISVHYDLGAAKEYERKIDNSKYFSHDKGDFGEEVTKIIANNNNLGQDVSDLFQVGRNGIDAAFLSKGPPPKLTVIESKASDSASFSYSDKQKMGGDKYFQNMINSGDPRYAGFAKELRKLKKDNPGLEFDFIRVETDIKITNIGFGVDELKVKDWSREID